MKLKSLLFFIFILLFGLIPFDDHAQTIPKLKLGEKGSYLQFGGALRFNYNYSNWIKESNLQGGEFGFDVFRLNVESKYKSLLFNAEYRFYAAGSGGGMLKHGWMGYEFDSNQHLEIGQNTVPFGIMPYQSNNWFFNINYYLGMEDDADMGVKYVYDDGHWEVQAAFYKNSDMLNFHSDAGISASRYGYDIGGRNKEINQENLRVVKHFEGGEATQEIGGSAQAGGIYNIDTRRNGSRTAFALHYVLNYKRWNFKAQFTSYAMHPKDADQIEDKEGHVRPNPDKGAGRIEVAAYGARNYIATKGNSYIADLSYKIPVKNSFIEAVHLYTDFGLLQKRIDGFHDSYQVIPGVMLDMGPIFTYVDYAMGKNHPWLGPLFTEGLAEGGSHKWTARFNVNMGYYF